MPGRYGKRAGRKWTDEQRRKMADWQRQRHVRDRDFHEKALKGLKKARESRKLPWLPHTAEYKIYTKARNMQPHTLTEKQRKRLIQAVIDSRKEDEILDELEKNKE